MKYLIFAAGLALAVSYPVYSASEGPGKGEIQRVCTPKKDKAGKDVTDKNGKVVEECKDVKVRKKLEGTEIPPAKK